MYRTWRRGCALLLSLLLVLACVPAVAVYAPERREAAWEQIPNDSVEFRLGHEEQEELTQEMEHALTEVVRVSIELEKPSAMERVGSFTKGEASSRETAAYRERLLAQQNDLAARISETVLRGEALDVVWNLTLGANIISAYVRYGDIEAIRKVPGVKDVFLETRYEPMRANKADEPMMSVATEMTGVQQVWSSGYTGAGSIVAVVDTGLDTSHQSFDAGAFDHAIAELNTQRQANGQDPVDLMTQDDVAAVLNQLNAKAVKSSVTAADLYRTTKVPFGFNYVDAYHASSNDGLDVTHLNDTQGEHGSHVSGIATANRYIPDGNGGYLDAIPTVYTQGDAPDAQLLVMKVFGSAGGAYDSDYFAAIEDAIVLGADVVNLSLGSSVPGYATNSTYAAKLAAFADSDIVWANSAGNSYAWASFSNVGYLYADDASFLTAGSPGTYENALSVASVDNKGFTGEFLTVNGTNIFFNESATYGNEPIHTIAGTYQYVLIDGFGSEEEWGDIPISGKVAICSRGAISFYVKANEAVKKGAKAVIIYNNAPGTIGMNLTGYSYTAPVVSVTQADGAFMKGEAERKTSTSGLTYYEGVITVASGVAVNNPGNVRFYEMSDFSSWGVPGDMSLKPEITAPGGNIYSVFGTNQTSDGATAGGSDQYENMSGTSMASPQIAGLTAVLAQYARETDLLNTVNGFRTALGDGTLSQRQLLQSLMMSTSDPLREEESGGEYYSVMKQGSGLIDLEAAVNARSYIMMDSTATKSAADGKVKVELGDDPTRTGVYTATFTVYNFADVEQTFSLSADFFTQDVFDYDGAKYLDYWTAPLSANVSWTADNVSLGNAPDLQYDLDGNGAVTLSDAQALLDYLTGVRSMLAAAKTRDVDNDGNVDTHDVFALVEIVNSATVDVPAGGKTVVTVSFDLKDSISAYDYKGAYVEGFLYVQEAENWEGKTGVTHSIPVFGYYGSWTDPSMIDQGSQLQNWQNKRVEPYMASNASYKQSNDKAFLVKDTAGKTHFLGGNPAVPDGTYLPERDAMNASETLSTVKYTLIRNSAGTKLTVAADGEEPVVNNVSEKLSYSAFFSLSSGAWNYAYSAAGINFTPGAANEGKHYTATLTLAPEYYMRADGSVDWASVSPNGSYSIGFTVDSVPPVVDDVVKSFDQEGCLERLVIKTTDNQYIAAVALLSEQGEPFVKGENTSVFGSNSASDVGTQETYTFNMSDYFDDLADVPTHTMLQVYDYAGNLSTWRLNLNKWEQNNTDPTISLDKTALELIKGKAMRLTASVGPWGADDYVYWTTSDASIATVSDSGVVSAVNTGTCTITATTRATPAASATCEVTVIDRTLNATIWGANGKDTISQFSLSEIPSYTELSGKLNAGLASAAYGHPTTGGHFEGLTWVSETNATLYAASFDTDEFTSKLYEVDESTYALTEVTSFTDLGLGAMDFCGVQCITTAGSDDLIACVYASYILVIDATYNGILTSLAGYVDFSGYIPEDPDGGMNFLVGITYAGKNTLGTRDWIYLLDMNGNIYKTSLKKVGSGLGGLNNSVSIGDDVTLVCNLGYKVDMPYLQSLYYDGTDLYWTRYDTGENDVDLILVRNIDKASQREIVEVGSFESDVWPVGGLYMQGEHYKDLKVTALEDGDGTVLPTPAATDSVGEVDFQAVRAELKRLCGSKQSVEEPVEGAEPVSVTGTLNKVTVMPASVDVEDLNGESAEVDGIVHVTADGNGTTNGLYTVSYDPTEVELVSVSPVAGLVSINRDDANGALTYGFAALSAATSVDANEKVLDLSFKLKEDVDTANIDVTTVETNDDKPNEQEAVPIGFTGFEFTIVGKGAAFDPATAITTVKTGEFTVENEKACVVIARAVNGYYTILPATKVDGEENTYSFTVPEGFAKTAEILVALKGDVSGDGVITNKDVLQIKSAYLGKISLTGISLLLADVSGDNTITNKDVLQIKAAYLNKLTFNWN